MSALIKPAVATACAAEAASNPSETKEPISEEAPGAEGHVSAATNMQYVQHIEKLNSGAYRDVLTGIIIPVGKSLSNVLLTFYAVAVTGCAHVACGRVSHSSRLELCGRKDASFKLVNGLLFCYIHTISLSPHVEAECDPHTPAPAPAAARPSTTHPYVEMHPRPDPTGTKT